MRLGLLKATQAPSVIMRRWVKDHRESPLVQVTGAIGGLAGGREGGVADLVSGGPLGTALCGS